MKRKKLNESFITIVVLSDDGEELRSCMPSRRAMSLFDWYIKQLRRECFCIREVQLLDYAGRVFQSFKIHY